MEQALALRPGRSPSPGLPLCVLLEDLPIVADQCYQPAPVRAALGCSVAGTALTPLDAHGEHRRAPSSHPRRSLKPGRGSRGLPERLGGRTRLGGCTAVTTCLRAAGRSSHGRHGRARRRSLCEAHTGTHRHARESMDATGPMSHRPAAGSPALRPCLCPGRDVPPSGRIVSRASWKRSPSPRSHALRDACSPPSQRSRRAITLWGRSAGPYSPPICVIRFALASPVSPACPRADLAGAGLRTQRASHRRQMQQRVCSRGPLRPLCIPTRPTSLPRF